MRELNLTVFEPGDMLGTLSKDGKVAVFTVGPGGDLVPSDNRMFASGLLMDDPIEALDLSVRTYNVLKREGINTIEQMVALYDQGEQQMFEIRNFGVRCVDEVRKHVLRLRGEAEGK